MFLLHSNGILEMLRLENYSLFFVPAHRVTLIKNYFNCDYSSSLSENQAEMTCRKLSVTGSNSALWQEGTGSIFLLANYLAHNMDFKIPTPYPLSNGSCHHLLQRERLWISSKRLLSWLIFPNGDAPIHILLIYYVC